MEKSHFEQSKLWLVSVKYIANLIKAEKFMNRVKNI